MIDEKRLREIVIRAIRDFESEQKQRTVKKYYMVVTEASDEKYMKFLQSCSGRDDIRIIPVVKDERMDWQNRFGQFQNVLPSVTFAQERPLDLKDAVTIFPVVSRDLIAKTAVGFCDSDELLWIDDVIAAGGRIVFLTSGMKPFTGLETKGYVDRFLGYIRQLALLGIRFCHGPEEIRQTECPVVKQTGASLTQPIYNRPAYQSPAFIENQTRRKKVITLKDLDRYVQGNELVLYPGDILTDVARDRIRFQKIRVIRKEN